MTASSKQLTSIDSNELIEVIPNKLLDMMYRGPAGVIGDYIDIGDNEDMDKKSDTDAKSPATDNYIWLQHAISFWGRSWFQKQLLTLVEYAAPLEKVESFIRQAHTRNDSFLQSTLIQAIQRAVIGLDQTICDEKGKELDEGMAERLLKLHAELFPKDQEKALEQARLAAPLEDKEAKQKREQLNVDAMRNLFDAFIQNDAKALPEAIATFKAFVKNLKPAVISDNQYYLNLLHLISVAFDVLANRGGNLPPVAGERYGQWYGKLRDRFCFEIIGGALESDLPPRVKQILRAKLYHVLQGTQKVDRDIDISGALFRGNNTPFVLGVSCYDDFASRYLNGRTEVSPPAYPARRRAFSILIASNYISVQNLLYSRAQNRESLCDLVKQSCQRS